MARWFCAVYVCKISVVPVLCAALAKTPPEGADDVCAAGYALDSARAKYRSHFSNMLWFGRILAVTWLGGH